MTSAPLLSEESVGVQSHLNITQGIIQRMSANSASSKGWCITLVSAILVVVADKGKPNYLAIAFIPILLFLALDTYYLALERCFRTAYNTFIETLHAGRLAAKDLYVVTPEGSLAKAFRSALASPSIWPFYLTLSAMVGLTRLLVLS